MTDKELKLWFPELNEPQLRLLKRLQNQAIEDWAEEMGVCTACGSSMENGHYNNNAECQD